MVFCVRNKKEMEGLDEPPFDSEFGQKIYKNVSKAAWDEWLNRQKMLLTSTACSPGCPRRNSSLSSRWRSSSSAPARPCPRSSCRPSTNPAPRHRCKLNKDPKSRLDESRLRYVGTWLSLVEHSLGVRGVGSSNLPVPTILFNPSSFVQDQEKCRWGEIYPSRPLLSTLHVLRGRQSRSPAVPSSRIPAASTAQPSYPRMRPCRRRRMPCDKSSAPWFRPVQRPARCGRGSQGCGTP